jgi:hypothetical protein
LQHSHTVTSNVTIANHTVTQPTVTMPGHYHDFTGTSNTASLVTGNQSANHTHGIEVPSNRNYFVAAGSGVGSINYGTASGDTAGISNNHTHNVSGSIGYKPSSGAVSGNTATTCTVSGSAVSAHSVTNSQVSTQNALSSTQDIRPKYISVRYIMRVK